MRLVIFFAEDNPFPNENKELNTRNKQPPNEYEEYVYRPLLTPIFNSPS